MAVLNFDRTAFNRVLDRGLRGFAVDMDRLLIESIEQPLYPWPGFTKRKSGEEVFSPRNIVDLGEFRNSQQYSFPSQLTILFEWTAQHSVFVFNGFTTRSGSTYPARNPVLQTVEQYDLAAVLAQQLREVF